MQRITNYIALIILFAAAQSIWSQTSPRVYKIDEYHFRVPFSIKDADPDELKQVNLFISKDRGESWQPFAIAEPDQKEFEVKVSKDGEYWFAVQTVSMDGKSQPAKLADLKADIKVFVGDVEVKEPAEEPEEPKEPKENDKPETKKKENGEPKENDKPEKKVKDKNGEPKEVEPVEPKKKDETKKKPLTQKQQLRAIQKRMRDLERNIRDLSINEIHSRLQEMRKELQAINNPK